MTEPKKYEQIVEELNKRLCDTEENKIKMENAIKSAEVLCIKFAHDPRALREAKSVKQDCQSALEGIKVQIDLLLQLIEMVKKEIIEDSI